ncbi:MAG: DUF3800 domain-containing protein [Chloroflexi bacterium]|nr:DUF3800 domain-containing protein [Chloroflexota bacterium]
MKKTLEGKQWYFVDESGDPTFYDRHGNLIVGQEGCSPIFILGFVETNDPTSVRNALNNLHAQIAADEYLAGIPSLKKTNNAFHAKDDVPEVRQMVFKLLRTLDFKAQFVVARKKERIFRNSFHANETEFYDYLISLLFENVLHRYTENRIYISQRGTRVRQERLEHAVLRGVSQFEERWNHKVESKIEIFPHTAVGEPCLQVVDYMNWAVYRAFVKREMRYFKFIQDKVSLLVDRYDTTKYPKNWYSRTNPFDIKKASPL